jgi:hypothetical protein
MFGKSKENGIWFAPRADWKLMFRNHDALYIAAWRLRLRIMKPSGRAAQAASHNTGGKE